MLNTLGLQECYHLADQASNEMGTDKQVLLRLMCGCTLLPLQAAIIPFCLTRICTGGLNDACHVKLVQLHHQKIQFSSCL